MLVLCETCLPTGEPIPSNTRAKARKAFDAAPGLEPWFGIEQEYTLFDKDMVRVCSEAIVVAHGSAAAAVVVVVVVFK